MLVYDLKLVSADRTGTDERSLNVAVVIFRLQDYLRNPYVHRVWVCSLSSHLVGMALTQLRKSVVKERLPIPVLFV